MREDDTGERIIVKVEVIKNISKLFYVLLFSNR